MQTDLLDTASLMGLVREAVRKCGSQKDFAAMCGVSAAYVSDVLNQKRAPSDTILAAIGYEKIVRYRKTA